MSQLSGQRGVGRSKVDIDLDDVEFLLSLRMSITNIAKIMNVSRSTIYRRMKEDGRTIGLHRIDPFHVS